MRQNRERIPAGDSARPPIGSLNPSGCYTAAKEKTVSLAASSWKRRQALHRKLLIRYGLQLGSNIGGATILRFSVGSQAAEVPQNECAQAHQCALAFLPCRRPSRKNTERVVIILFAACGDCRKAMLAARLTFVAASTGWEFNRPLSGAFFPQSNPLRKRDGCRSPALNLPRACAECLRPN